MLMQPINSNNALSALHCLYVGNNQSYRPNIVLGPTRRLQRQVLRRYKSFAKFFKAAIAGRKTQSGFKIALTVPETRENLLRFCEIVKALGDGKHKKQLHAVCEEVPESLGKEKGAYGWLLAVGRKFGIVVHSVGQRVVEMSKTTLSQSIYKWVGMQASIKDAMRMAEECDIPLKDIKALKKLEYFFKSPGIGNVEFGKLRV